MEQADRLARFSESERAITRVFLSAEHRAAGEWLMALMAEAGMTARFDEIGNVVGRYEGAQPGARALLIASHIDTVRDAGRYDGTLGVLIGIACVRELNRLGRRLPFAIEVVGFGDEEGTRFGVAMMGSRALAGRLDADWLDVADAKGVTMRQALIGFGGDPGAIPRLSRRSDPPLAYLEVHIEQGPVLLEEGLPVGIVTEIVGTSRIRCRLTGLAGHAGTVPMARRRDALAAAAEMVLVVERIANETAGLVGTVGLLNLEHGAVNTIPGAVMFTIDLRAGRDALRAEAEQELRRQLETIAGKRGVGLAVEKFYVADAVLFDPSLKTHLEQAVARQGVRVLRLASGAGHDAMDFVGLCPAAMLFVRSGNGGISHHPLESVTAEDVDVAVRVLLDTVESIGATAS